MKDMGEVKKEVMPSRNLAQVFREIVESLGYEFVGLSTPREGGNLILRLYVDILGGMTVGDCEKVSRKINEYLDEFDPLPEERYYLEVSSPGIERPLFALEDYARFMGRPVKITLKEALPDGRKRLSGTVEAIETTGDEDVMILKTEQEVEEVKFSQVAEGRLAFVENKGTKKTFKKKGGVK